MSAKFCQFLTPLLLGVRVRKARFITQSQDFSKSVLIGPYLDVICMIWNFCHQLMFFTNFLQNFFVDVHPCLTPLPPMSARVSFPLTPLPPPCGRLLWMTPNEKVPMRLIQICIILYDL